MQLPCSTSARLQFIPRLEVFMEHEKMIPIRIELLGSLRFTFGKEAITAVKTNRMRSLLAFLVLNQDGRQSREHVAFLLWPESDQAQARTNLRQLLHNLRHSLPVGCSLLSSDNASVRWLPDSACTVDVFEFEQAIHTAERAWPDDHPASRKALQQAIGLYQDDLLPDLYDEWLRPRREQLRLQFATALARMADLLAGSNEIGEGIRYATRMVALDPLREDYYQTLMRLHLRNNDRSSALRVFHQCKRSLQRELGVSPAKATLDIFTEALKSGDAIQGGATIPPPMAPTKPLPLVGRRLEWERLSACWRRVTEGDSHFVVITGEPGIGKTRLAEEFAGRCAEQSGHVAAIARCYMVQGQFAYGPVTEWLRTEPLRIARQKLPRPQLTELARLAPEILIETPGLASPQPLAESWQRLHLHEALTSVLRLASKPLLLLVDDLQWCDQDSFDWLLSLFRSAPTERFLVIGTVRAGDTGRSHPLAGLIQDLRQREQLSEVAMEPLSAEETASLAAQTASRKIAPSALRRIYEATQGNPLFVVESIRASLDEQLSEREVPPRIQAIISARLAQLSVPAWELAGLAAAIGRSFTMELLAKATDWDEGSLSKALEELWRFRIIDGQDGVAYDYTHGLLRDVAYAEVNPIRKRLLHRRIARALAETYSPDFEPLSGWLAGHYDAAGMAEQAIRFYRDAATVAKQRFADAEAANLIRRALALCLGYPESARRDKEELELLVTLGASLVKTDGYTMPEVGETYERGLVLSNRCGDRTHLFPLLSGSWAFRIVRGRLEDSRRVAQDYLDRARGQNGSRHEESSHFLLATSLFHLGKLHTSWEEIGLAGSSTDGPPHPALSLFAGPDVGVFRRAYLSHLLCLFDREEATAQSTESIAVARQVSHPFTLAIALDYAAMFNVYCGDAAAVGELADEASGICRKFGFVYYLGVADILSGWAAATAGNAASGIGQIRLGLEALKSLGAELRLPFYCSLMAEACERAGRTGDALANVATGIAFLNKNAEAWIAPEVHRIHGDILLRSGDRQQATTSYARAIDLSRKMGALRFERRAAKRLREVSVMPEEQDISAER